MRFVVLAAIGIGRDQRAVVELHGGAEAAALVAEPVFGVEHEPVVGEIELEAVVGLDAGDGPHAQRRIADRER